jgi:imidazolonepropionase-like amidohydrolase
MSRLNKSSSRIVNVPKIIKSTFLFALAAITMISAVHAETITVKADTLYTSAKQGVIKDAVVWIKDNKIIKVGKYSKIGDAKNSRIVEAKVVTPGLIDAHTVVGINGAFNQHADQDGFEQNSPNGAEMRVLDSFNPAEDLVQHVLSYGVTTIHVTPEPAAPIAGNTALFKTHGLVADDMLLKDNVAMLFNLGNAPKYEFSKQNISTRMKTAAFIREALYGAKHWQSTEKEKRSPDLSKQSLERVLSGQQMAIFTAHREDDIATALRLSKEFNLVPVINYATEGYLMTDKLKQASATVIHAPPMQRALGMEKGNATLESAAILNAYNVPTVFASGYEGYVPKTRVLLWEMAIAVANGLPAERAITMATSDAAKLFKVNDKVGSIEVGKDADIVLFDGDPFEYTTHVLGVFVNGQLAYDKESDKGFENP